MASVDESAPESTDESDEPEPAAVQGVSVAEALAELASRAAAARQATQQRQAEGYDPLAGWDAGGSREV